MNAWKQIALACVSLLALGLAPTGVALAQVKVTAANPSSAYQGTYSLDVVVSGSGFNKSAKVQYFVSGTTNPGGITVRNVRFNSSTELLTTIDVADTADLASFDIVVTLDSGRKGKGTTLFKVNVKPNPHEPPPPAPTYPPGRFWHAFAGNGGETAASSVLYMFAGDSNGSQPLGDLWMYRNAGSSEAAWTYVQPGTSAPGPRWHVAWSCGGGRCVAANGISVPAYLKETWVFTESTQSWSQVSCPRRSACPSARAFATMAYDPSTGTHLLFGGNLGTSVLFRDTYSFNPGTMSWTSYGDSATVSTRDRAAATFVPPLGRVVMFGGQQEWRRVLNEMYVWDGKVWSAIAQVVDGTMTTVPFLHSHSMAWDPAANHLIVTGGLVDTNDTPNTLTFYVSFSTVGGVWRANWTRASGIGCQAATSSPPDAVVHPQARMAFDVASGVQVFFGGTENLPDVGAYAYDNTVECR